MRLVGLNAARSTRSMLCRCLKPISTNNRCPFSSLSGSQSCLSLQTHAAARYGSHISDVRARDLRSSSFNSLTSRADTYEPGVDSKSARAAPNEEGKEYPLILRAVDGGDVKFSTLVCTVSDRRLSSRTDTHLLLDIARTTVQVQPSELSLFQQSYGTLLKAKMTTHMRKRDKKREKLRAERLTARKKRLAVEIVVEGPKRGAGRLKRQRRAKSAKKQQVARERVRKAEELKAKKAAENNPAP